MEEAYEAHTVAVFERHDQAEAALRELQRNGIDMTRMSIVGRDPHTEQHPVGFDNAAVRARSWGKRGAFWGAILGIVFGPVFFWIPGVGFVLIGGLLGSFLLGTLEGAATGAAVGGTGGAIAGALTHMGIPKDSAIRYEESIKADRFILIGHGSSAEAAHYRQILGPLSADVAIHGKVRAEAAKSA